MALKFALKFRLMAEVCRLICVGYNGERTTSERSENTSAGIAIGLKCLEAVLDRHGFNRLTVIDFSLGF